MASDHSARAEAGAFSPFLRALGALVVNFNAADHTLRRLTWMLIDPVDDRIGQIVIDAAGVARLEDLVAALAQHRIKDAQVVTRLNDALQRCRAVRDSRNRYVHAFWRVPNEAVDLSDLEAARPPTRRRDEYQVVDGTGSVDELRSVSRSAYELGVELEVLLQAVRKLLRA